MFSAPMKGEPALVAAVVWTAEPAFQSLLDYAKEKKLPLDMTPKGVMSVAELPRNEAGKVVRSQLKALFEQGLQNEKPVLH